MLKQMIKLLVLAGLFSLIVACGGGDDDTTASPTETPPPTATEIPTPEPTDSPTVEPTPLPPTATPPCTELTVTNRDLAESGAYEFDPSDMNFTLGETVCFTQVGETEYHTFTVDELGIDFDVDASVEPGASREFTHTFDQAGTFQLVCLVHELDGMVGTITVSE